MATSLQLQSRWLRFNQKQRKVHRVQVLKDSLEHSPAIRRRCSPCLGCWLLLLSTSVNALALLRESSDCTPCTINLCNLSRHAVCKPERESCYSMGCVTASPMVLELLSMCVRNAVTAVRSNCSCNVLWWNQLVPQAMLHGECPCTASAGRSTLRS